MMMEKIKEDDYLTLSKPMQSKNCSIVNTGMYGSYLCSISTLNTFGLISIGCRPNKEAIKKEYVAMVTTYGEIKVI